jgi:hypothetical protein
MDTEREREITTADLANPEAGRRDNERRAVEPDFRTDRQTQMIVTSPPDDGALSADSAAMPEDGIDRRGTSLANDTDIATSPLFAADEAERFRNAWREVQGEFVDEPREAVKQADRLVADLMQRLASQFSEQRAGLEERWDGQQDVSTEDLRVALTRYRSFFERLLQA